MTADILEKIGNYRKSFDKVRILKAIDFVNDTYQHTGGDINSNFNVLEILLPLKPDEDTIVAILLHDLYLKSLIKEETIKENFGQPVFGILAALKKLSALNYVKSEKGTQMEILRKMFLTLAKDIRVILIWLACRLCVLRNLAALDSAENTIKLAMETMNIYVPIASRLGIYNIKIQLEDLAFRYLNPQEYERLNRQVDKFDKNNKLPIDLIKQQLENFFASKDIKAAIHGRIKSIYSIYTKLTLKGLTNVDELYDFFAIRVILPHKQQLDHLYGALGLIHNEWKPVSSRFKDYIAVPKPNGYRSLHTVVLGLGPQNLDKLVEIQIRDEHMHRESEYGVASHWLYKASRGSSGGELLNYNVDWIRGLEQIHEFFGEQSDVMKEVAIDIFKDRIFVLTPRGEVKDLTLGSTPIDFAYAVHTDIGNKCIGANVNGSIVPLDYRLKNGDVVKIITRADATPKLRWLSVVKSDFAKSRIKTWLSAFNWDKNVKHGRMLLNAQLEHLKKPSLDQNYSILKNYGGKNLTLIQRESLIEEIGKGGKFTSDIVRMLYPYEKVLFARKAVSRIQPSLVAPGVMEKHVLVGGESGMPVKFASCCKPKPGDSIMAYVANRGKKISVHKNGCLLFSYLSKERMLIAEWQ